jgi:hypothetical protein
MSEKKTIKDKWYENDWFLSLMAAVSLLVATIGNILIHETW